MAHTALQMDAFAWKEERTLSQALSLQYDKVVFILEPSEQAKAAIGKRVTIIDYPDGRLSIRETIFYRSAAAAPTPSRTFNGRDADAKAKDRGERRAAAASRRRAANR